MIVQKCERCIFWLILFSDHFPPLWWKMVWEQDYLLQSGKARPSHVWREFGIRPIFEFTWHSFIHTANSLASVQTAGSDAVAIVSSAIRLDCTHGCSRTNMYKGLIPDPPLCMHVEGLDYIFEQLVYFQNPYIQASSSLPSLWQSLDLLVCYHFFKWIAVISCNGHGKQLAARDRTKNKWISELWTF